MAQKTSARIAAVDVLAPWRSLDDEACKALSWAAAWDDRAAVRDHAMAVLQRGDAPCATELLLGAARAQSKRSRMEPLLRRAVALADDDDGARIVALLADRPDGFRVPLTSALRSEVRARVARRLALFPHAAAVDALTAVLRDVRPDARRAAQVALEMLANQRFAGIDAARSWGRALRAVQPLQWLVDGFARLGLPATAPAGELVPGLLELLRGPDQVLARNAERALEILTGGQRLAHADTPRHRHRAWARFWAHVRELHAGQRLVAAPSPSQAAPPHTAHAQTAPSPSPPSLPSSGASEASRTGSSFGLMLPGAAAHAPTR